MRSEQIFSLVTFDDKRLYKCTLFFEILMLSYVRRCVKLIPLKSALGKMYTLLESKSMFQIEQKAIVSCFINCVFTGTPGSLTTCEALQHVEQFSGAFVWYIIKQLSHE